MISFIVYENDNLKKELYTKIIRKFFYTSYDHYDIYEYDRDNSDVQNAVKHIEGMRVYLINIDIPDINGLEVARRIRKEGDFISPIILITSHDKRNLVGRLHGIFYLDILYYDDEFIKNLLYSLKDAYKVVTRHSVYTFSSFDEVYRIPYNDIYYIVKNLNDDSVTIYTKDDSYLNYISVKGIEKELEHDPRFFKSHRSCIINLYNVSLYDRKDNIVMFNNGLNTNLVARHSKAALAEKLKEYSNQ